MAPEWTLAYTIHIRAFARHQRVAIARERQSLSRFPFLPAVLPSAFGSREILALHRLRATAESRLEIIIRAMPVLRKLMPM